MTCKAYQIERNEYFTKVNSFIVRFESYASQEQFLYLMSTNDTEVLTLLMQFSEIAILQRDNQAVFKS